MPYEHQRHTLIQVGMHLQSRKMVQGNGIQNRLLKRHRTGMEHSYGIGFTPSLTRASEEKDKGGGLFLRTSDSHPDL